MSEPIGVLVMAHGTPRTAEDIEPFYTRIRRGRPPSPEQLDDLKRRYGAIGGLSPLTERTMAQVEAVRAALERRSPGHFVVAYGAKHSDPLIEDAVASLCASGVRTIIGLVLTPHGSTMGSGEYFERAEAALVGDVALIPVSSWYAEPDLVKLLGILVGDALATLGPDVDQQRFPVIFTAHSLPERVVAAGDTYPAQLEESARLVAAAAGVERWQVAWQSAGRTPEPWLGPDVGDVVGQLRQADGVVLCPIGFVADHLEVLYDLDVELAEVAAHGGLRYARTASLNDDPRFISVLADVIGAAHPSAR
jgi:ferrochelatase